MKALVHPGKRPNGWLVLFSPVQCCITGGLLLTGLLFGLLHVARHGPPLTAALSRLARRTKQVVGLAKPVDFPIELWFKADSDARRYSGAVLSNGLEVLAVQDNRSLFSSFAVAVEAGSFQDPAKLPGLAHFCEHMLFSGTKSHPGASDFDRFVQLNGGSDNAYTGDETTVYYMSIAESAARGGLERFAAFFAEPSFNRTVADKEVHAIDSEHDKNIQSPAWRVNAVLASLASPSSPVARFGTGNLETLRDGPKANDIDVVAELRNFWQQHYCPEKMKVVSFGPSSTDDQLKAMSKTFGAVKSNSLSCSMLPRKRFDPQNVWPPESMGKYVHIQGTTHEAGLLAIFYLPDMQKHIHSKPLRYIEWVIAFDGEGSLLQVLRDRLDLVTALSVDADGSSAGWQLTVSFTLTEHGRQQRSAVLDLLFAYLAAVRAQGVDEALHRSLERRAALAWDWAEPSDGMDLAQSLADRMTRLPVYHVLWGDELLTKPDLALVRSVLGMLSPERMNVAYVLPSTDSLKAHGLPEKQLPHYGVKHSVQDIGAELGARTASWSRWLRLADEGKLTDGQLLEGLKEVLSATDLELSQAVLRDLPLPRIPHEIQGLPDKVEMAHAKVQLPSGESDSATDARLFGPTPEVSPLADVKSGSGLVGPLEFWHRAGWASNLPIGSPRAALGVMLRARRPADAPEASALDDMRMQLFSLMLGEELSPYLADLQASGNSVGLGVSEDGISFGLWSFPASLSALVDSSLSLFARHEALKESDPRRFKRVVDTVRQGLLTNAEMPVSYALGEISRLLERGAHSKQELLEALKQCTLENSASVLQDLVLRWPLELTALALGNVDTSDGARAVRAAVDALRPTDRADAASAEGAAVEYVTRIVEPGGPVEIRGRNPRPGDKSHVVAVTVLAGVATVRSKVQLALLGDLLGQVAFEVLRTELQLGYVASGGVQQLSNVQALQCYVQGDVLTADEMEAAIHRVLSLDVPRRLRAMSVDDLERLKEAFRSSLVEAPYQTGEEWEHWWAPVADNSFCFSQREALLAQLDTVKTPSELAQVWNATVLEAGEAKVRKIITVKYFPGSTIPEKLPNSEAITEWTGLGLPSTYIDTLVAERAAAVELPQASAAARKLLLDRGGRYYPATLNCGLSGKDAIAGSSLLEQVSDASVLQARVQRTAEAEASHALQAQAQRVVEVKASGRVAEVGDLQETMAAAQQEDDVRADPKRPVPRFARSRNVPSSAGGVLAAGLEGA